jgi:hypothetical protein
MNAIVVSDFSLFGRGFKWIPLFVLLFWFGLAASAQAAAPQIFFSDLESGPKTGGESNNGAFVTLYGNNFGTSPSVTVGGGQVLIKVQPVTYLWYQKMTIQLGSNAATGNIVITNSDGSSNGLPFTVRAGSIYFASGSGSDSNNGSYSTPFRTIYKARDTMVAGDIVYAMTGSDAPNLDPCCAWHSALLLNKAGSAGKPLSFVVYPGHSVAIGSLTGSDVQYGIRAASTGTYLVFAGFEVTSGGPESGINVVENTRVVGNNVSCPKGNAPDGCITTGGDFAYVYGNNVHDSGKNVTPSKLWHQIYLSASHQWVGWNSVHDNYDCRGIQQNSSFSAPQYDIHIFSNLIYNDPCDGINLATTNPSLGTVEVYNNVIYNVGYGGGGTDNEANFAGIYVADMTDQGCGSGQIQIYNNTIYNAGSYNGSGNSVRGAINKNGPCSGITVLLRNNLIYQKSGQLYLASAGGNGLSQISGSNNLWYGLSSAPTQTTGNITADPKLVSPGLDFRLSAGSPAIDAGSNVSTLKTGVDGIVRPQGIGVDIGAYEYGSSSTPGNALLPPSAWDATLTIKSVQ